MGSTSKPNAFSECCEPAVCRPTLHEFKDVAVRELFSVLAKSCSRTARLDIHVHSYPCSST
jgi:hypothetical protein